MRRTREPIRKQLTDTLIRGLEPAAKGTRVHIWDKVVPNFGVRVTDKGAASYVYYARFPPSLKPTRRLIGNALKMSLKDARAKARDWEKIVAKGDDPAGVERQRRLAAQRSRQTTFEIVAEDWLKDAVIGKQRKADEVARDVRRVFLAKWGSCPVAEVTKRDVRDLIRSYRDTAPAQGHNLLGYAKRLFRWAVDQDCYGLTASPAEGLRPKDVVGEKKLRKRILTDDELRAFWRATSRMRYPYGPEGRLLLLTGQRHREVGEARRAELHPELIALIRRQVERDESVDWDAVKPDWKLWSVGEERFKSDAQHMVCLSNEACALIAGLPFFKKGGHLFSTTLGEKPTVISDKIKNEIDSRMIRTLRALARARGEDPRTVELKPWVIHDLRRTLRTHLSALRVPDHVAEMVIGHGRRGLQRVYDQHRYEREMREALQAWATRLREIVDPRRSSNNVVRLHGGR